MSVGNRFIEGENDDVDENEVENQSDMDLEIVTSSGHGKNGTLCVLQNSIKPQIITSFDLSGMFKFFLIKFVTMQYFLNTRVQRRVDCS